MLWLFVIVGIVGLASAMHGAIAFRPRGPSTLVALAAIALFAAAWWLGHESAAGWIVLSAGIIAEAIRRFGLARELKLAAAAPMGSGGAQSVDAAPIIESCRPEVSPEPTPPAAMEPPPPPLTCTALLASPYRFSADVLLASLRRAGQRGAQLTRSGEGGGVIQIDGVTLTAEYQAAPLPRDTIEEAAGQSWDWPEALDAAASHVSCIRFTAQVPAYRRAVGDHGTSREDAIRALCRAQRALAEFAPLVTVLWNGGGRLTPPTALAGLIDAQDAFRLAAATCVNFRTFPPEEKADAAAFVSDTLGLDALDLADVQLATDKAPDDAVSAAIFALARRQFETGVIPADGEPCPIGNVQCTLRRDARPRFGRPRRMIEWIIKADSTPSS